MAQPPPALHAPIAGATGVHRLNQREDQHDASARSQPADRRAVGRWQTQTFGAGLRCHELVAPWVIDGAMDGEAFDLYVRTRLAPCLSPGDVVIMDNLNVHKSPRAAKALAERGAWRLLLPKYSPDLNPIEIAFSKLKTLLRKAKA